jgi:phage shock protein PspC (stress-responsive transcriptional regulator)
VARGSVLARGDVAGVAQRFGLPRRGLRVLAEDRRVLVVVKQLFVSYLAVACCEPGTARKVRA